MSKQLEKVLEKSGYQVSLTRTDDRFLRLDERSRKANGLYADLFISIHINSLHDATASGIELFCLRDDLFEHQHGHHHTRKEGGAHHYRDARNVLHAESESVAYAIHEKLLSYARKKNPQVVDRGVLYKVPQVLFGVHMPAVLIELGFLSNKQEKMLLVNPDYQSLLVKGIAEGVQEFFAGR